MLKDRLVKLRTDKSLSQYQLARILGLSRGQLSNYELGTRQPDYQTLVSIADFFGVTVDSLIKDDTKIEMEDSQKGDALAHAGQERSIVSAVSIDTVKKSSSDLKGQMRDGLRTVKMVEVPVYELDVKGEEILADSNIIGWHYVPAEQMDCICFRVPDDSMSGSGLYTGYIVTVIKQDTAEDGKIAIVKSKDGNFCIRRVRYFNDEVLLDPDNPRYQSERININELIIIGVVTDASFKVI